MVNEFVITDYGAVGDGKTDCTAAVQQALDLASGCMGTVIVPPGIYMVGQLKMHGDDVSLVGTSAWLFRQDGASVLRLNDANAECMLDISGAFGCTIRGVCMDGCGLGSNIHGIKLWWKEYNGGVPYRRLNRSRCGIRSGQQLLLSPQYQ